MNWCQSLYSKLDLILLLRFKSLDKDGYLAVQVSTIGKKAKKPQVGHCQKAGLKKEIPSVTRELRFKKPDNGYQVGQRLKVEDVFEVGDAIKVTARSKGKGFLLE